MSKKSTGVQIQSIFNSTHVHNSFDYTHSEETLLKNQQLPSYLRNTLHFIDPKN